MVSLDAFEALDQRFEAVRHEHEFAFGSTVSGLAGQSCDVLQARSRPVVDDEQGQDGRADRIQPPNTNLMPDQGKQKRQRVEVHIRLAILCQSLDLCSLYSCATDPDCTLDYDGSYHGEYRSRRESRNIMITARQELLDGLLKNLHEGDDHDDGEDEDTERFEASATDGELLLELV